MALFVLCFGMKDMDNWSMFVCCILDILPTSLYYNRYSEQYYLEDRSGNAAA